MAQVAAAQAATQVAMELAQSEQVKTAVGNTIEKAGNLAVDEVGKVHEDARGAVKTVYAEASKDSIRAAEVATTGLQQGMVRGLGKIADGVGVAARSIVSLPGKIFSGLVDGSRIAMAAVMDTGDYYTARKALKELMDSENKAFSAAASAKNTEEREAAQKAYEEIKKMRVLASARVDELAGSRKEGSGKKSTQINAMRRVMMILIMCIIILLLYLNESNANDNMIAITAFIAVIVIIACEWSTRMG